MAIFLPSSPHNSMRVHVSLAMASPLKNGRMWSAVSLKTTNPCAKLPLITACPTKRSDASFVLGVELRKLSCTDVHSFSLLEESNTTGAEVVKALPNLEAKAKGDKSMD